MSSIDSIQKRLHTLRSQISKQLAPESSIAADFILTLLHSSTSAHLLHLQSRSYSQHMALGAYYEGVVDLADSFAETYQGRYGLVAGYQPGYAPPMAGGAGAVDLISAVCDYIGAVRVELPQDSHLQNIIDEIVALADSTRYKLINLA